MSSDPTTAAGSSPFEFDVDRDLWERQSWESAAAYGHFHAYARLPYLPENRRPDGGVGTRRLQDVADAGGVALSTLKTHSAGKRWAERAAAYDAAQRAEESRAIREAERDGQMRAARRRIAGREKLHAMFEQAAARAVEILSFPLFEDSETEYVPGPDGTPVMAIVRTALDGVTANTPAALVKATVDLFRVSTDTGSGAMDELLDLIDYDALSPDQLSRISEGENPVHVILSGLTGEGAGPRRAVTENP